MKYKIAQNSEAVKKLPMFNVQCSIVIFGGASGAAFLRKKLREAPHDDK
jgi:hypothetical protein